MPTQFFEDSFYSEEFESCKFVEHENLWKAERRSFEQHTMDCVDSNISGSNIGTQINRTYDSVEKFIHHANLQTSKYQSSKTAWLVYDRVSKGLKFLYTPEKYMPNPSRMHTLLGYKIDRAAFQNKADPIWSRVNWIKIDERLTEALENPVKID